MDTVLNIQALPPAVAAGGIALFFIKEYVANQQRSKKSTSSSPPPPPEVAGLPVIGNLLQLKEKKPHKTFTKWAEKYGPIYSIKAGSTSMVVLNSKDVAKEAMVTKYSSISTRKMTNALKILSWDKGIVALSDYNDFHKVAKRHLLTSSLGPDAQKRQRIHRDAMMNNICFQFHAHAEAHPSQPVNFRKIFQSEIFRFSLKQAIGEDVESIYVEELGRCLSREEIYKILVIDPMEGAIDVDWRDLFPFFNWIPNPEFENRLHNMFFRREVVMKALIHHHKECVASGKEMEYCYLSHLLSEGADKLTEGQILSLVWEDIIEAADTTLITMEWAMYQLSKHPHKQDRLLSEIQNACGSDQLTEEKLCKLPYLAAVFHETLRKHSPVPVVPLRYVHQDTELGGYKIPQGTQIAINIYGCNMDKKVWESPEEWMPERFAKDNGCTELHKTMAFGLGKRVCAGAQQAMTVSCMAIGRLVQEFQWQLGDGEEEKVDTVGLTTHKLHPLLTIITPRLN